MRYILPVLLFLLVTAPAYAQEPTPAPGGGAINVPQDNLPYTFEVLDYDEGGSPMANLNFFDDPAFVNLLGSTSLTLFSILDSQNVLAIFVVILLAAWMLWRVYKFTTTSTPGTLGDLSVYPEGDDEAPEEYDLERRYSSNPYRVYRQRLVRRK